MDPLARPALEHHERLVEGAERLHALAEMADADTSLALRAGLASELAFLERELLPHIEVVERELYGRLQDVLEGHHSLVPMREEHRQLRELVRTLASHRPAVESGRLEPGAVMTLRRVLYRLHSLLRVHLAEELVYWRALETHLGADERAELARTIEEAGGQHL